ncbi:NTP transferase domain-containing protein [soil metagenome]
MKGIILAAGAGTRLNGQDTAMPKCMLSFAGRPLIELQLRALRSCGIDEVTVLVGFEADRVRRACGEGVQFIENTRFSQTNSLYSLSLARPVLMDGFVVMNCDVLFHPALLLDLLTARHADALLVSYPKDGDPPFGEEEMKVHVRRGRVVDMGKDLSPSMTDGENVGIAKFSADAAASLVAAMDRRLDAGNLRDWAPRAFADYAREGALYAIGTRGLPWTEIDTADDYRYASTVVYPAIRRVFHDLPSERAVETLR